jgi:hypothetical protein
MNSMISSFENLSVARRKKVKEKNLRMLANASGRARASARVRERDERASKRECERGERADERASAYARARGCVKNVPSPRRWPSVNDGSASNQRLIVTSAPACDPADVSAGHRQRARENPHQDFVGELAR